jgi:hypothetical protein
MLYFEEVKFVPDMIADFGVDSTTNLSGRRFGNFRNQFHHFLSNNASAILDRDL